MKSFLSYLREENDVPLSSPPVAPKKNPYWSKGRKKPSRNAWSIRKESNTSMKSFLEYLTESESEQSPVGVTDAWFNSPDTFQTFKIGTPIKFETTKAAGTVDTLEGPVAYEAGHHIVTGPKGERYPVSPDKFKTLYDDNGDGSATPKKIMKSARLADHDGVLKTSWGDLTYKKGQHYIVKHGSSDFGAVQSDIFDQTYNR